ncbi:hypothetical protein [Cellulomonas soli]|uniref:Uncharacterized protein n=1 Tax=Cellulomonas soli TaxID=931535 RepID=A0A512PFJ7_9CELL|nr:hypothetical protein [Cellulomonas soli]NYI59890.1 hypothetical protein [Cellulomonas soli]GEP69967.1 hypothetical protein CSO01_26820 [Cellulomonas soli]
MNELRDNEAGEPVHLMEVTALTFISAGAAIAAIFVGLLATSGEFSWLKATLILAACLAAAFALRPPEVLTVDATAITRRTVWRTTVLPLTDVVAIERDWVLKSGNEIRIHGPNVVMTITTLDVDTVRFRLALAEGLSGVGSPLIKELRVRTILGVEAR